MAKKNVGTIFLWLATMAIIAHAIVPHHHHLINKKEHQTCSNHYHNNTEHHNHQRELNRFDELTVISIIDSIHSSKNHQECVICLNDINFTQITLKKSIESQLHFGYFSLILDFYFNTEKHFEPFAVDYFYLFAQDKQSRGPPSYC
ncbi:MAG: hypothetical protein U9R19_02560 [Bacteroidota bacterium]|nr:hypothetical protein [Bacteroidota bacterium]